MPEISIIVPVYNVEEYIQRCIDSLLVQTYKEIEILLIDDGSKDRSGTICDEYALKDDRIRVIHKANGGVSSARNTGLDNAAGRYIMFCDPDDYVEPTWCEKLFDAIERSGGFFACCGYNCVTLSGELQNTKVIQRGGLKPAEALVELYVNGALPSACYKIFNAKTIKMDHIRYDEKLNIAEDFLFVLCYLRTRIDNLEIVPEALYNYVTDRPQSLTKKIVPEHWKLSQHVRDEVHMTMQAYGVDFSEYREAYYSGLITTILQSMNMIFNYNVSNREKFARGKAILSSDECKDAFRYGRFKGVHPIYKIILQTRCFALVCFFHWAVKLKHRMVDKKENAKR